MLKYCGFVKYTPVEAIKIQLYLTGPRRTIVKKKQQSVESSPEFQFRIRIRDCCIFDCGRLRIRSIIIVFL